MGKIVLLLAVALSSCVWARSDIYMLNAWQSDGRLDQQIQRLGQITAEFFVESDALSAKERIDRTLTTEILVSKISKLQTRAIQSANTNEKVLVLTISTHGWVYKNQHYLSISGGRFLDIRDPEECVERFDDFETDTECGLLSSTELAHILQGTIFDKVIFLTSACYSGQIIEDFKRLGIMYPKIAVVASTDKSNVAIAGVFEDALESYFSQVTMQQFAQSKASDIQTALVKGSRLIWNAMDLSMSSIMKSRFFVQQTHVGQIGNWRDDETLMRVD